LRHFDAPPRSLSICTLVSMSTEGIRVKELRLVKYPTTWKKSDSSTKIANAKR